MSFSPGHGDVVQFVRRLKIWALQAGKSDVDVVIMVNFLLDGPTLDWYIRSVPIGVKNVWAHLQQALLTQFQKPRLQKLFGTILEG